MIDEKQATIHNTHVNVVVVGQEYNVRRDRESIEKWGTCTRFLSSYDLLKPRGLGSRSLSCLVLGYVCVCIADGCWVGGGGKARGV